MAANPAKRKAWRKKWKKANPQKVLKTNAAWRRAHPEFDVVHDERRRARRAAVPNAFGARDLREAKEVSCGICAYCLRPTKHLTIDHVTPLARGGSHTPENIVMACRSCNSKKGARGVLSMVNQDSWL